MEKTKIISEIKRLAAANAGAAPGLEAFERATGIRQADWWPHYWLRWTEAVVEAGFQGNEFKTAIGDEVLYQKYIDLIRELKHLPVQGELRLKSKTDKSFPSHNVFRRLGGQAELMAKLLAFCRERPEDKDIVDLIEAKYPASAKHVGPDKKPSAGFVYLMKSGRHYKIGRTNSVGARERQLAIKIPVPPTTIHSIETDDPAGVEAYWHRRFDEKRGEGEWFDLSLDDVQAFKRWRRIF